MLRVVCISDTHSLHRNVQVPEGDLLIHAGDQCNHGLPSELRSFGRWYRSLPHAHKVLIAGNHDWPWLRRRRYGLMWLRGCHYLQDSSCRVQGLKVWGSPWQPEFCDWAFNLPRGPRLAEVWAKIPDDVDILVTHTPPLGILDNGLGCADLRARVEQLPKLRLHVFGHIHGAAGQLEQGGCVFVNAAICDEQYAPVQPVRVIDLPV